MMKHISTRVFLIRRMSRAMFFLMAAILFSGVLPTKAEDGSAIIKMLKRRMSLPTGRQRRQISQ